MSEVRLFTASETFIHDKFPPNDEGYLRVVSIEAGGDPIVLHGPIPAEAKAITFEANHVFSERLRSFSETFLTAQAPVVYAPDDILYNCFLFADALRPGATGLTTNPAEAEQIMHNVLMRKHRIGRCQLPLGAIGCIGEFNGIRPKHAMVSLGPEAPLFLQVMGRNGYLGLQPLDTALRYYRKNYQVRTDIEAFTS